MNLNILWWNIKNVNANYTAWILFDYIYNRMCLTEYWKQQTEILSCTVLMDGFFHLQCLKYVWTRNFKGKPHLCHLEQCGWNYLPGGSNRLNVLSFVVLFCVCGIYEYMSQLKIILCFYWSYSYTGWCCKCLCTSKHGLWLFIKWL